jgi:hypothetical protein
MDRTSQNAVLSVTPFGMTFPQPGNNLSKASAPFVLLPGDVYREIFFYFP